MDFNLEWEWLIVKGILLPVDVNEYTLNVPIIAVVMVSVIPAVANVTAVKRLGLSLIVLLVLIEELVNVLAIVQEMECVSMESVIVLVAGETAASTQR